MSEIITDVSPEEVRAFADEVLSKIPEEKVKQNLALIDTAKALEAEGSMRTNQGLGQRVASIPARIYYRFHQEFPGCWQDQEFVDAFLTDNPHCCDPGYTPKQYALRHGKTFIGGKPV